MPSRYRPATECLMDGLTITEVGFSDSTSTNLRDLRDSIIPNFLLYVPEIGIVWKEHENIQLDRGWGLDSRAFRMR
jgi:hypothetical protein